MLDAHCQGGQLVRIVYDLFGAGICISLSLWHCFFGKINFQRTDYYNIFIIPNIFCVA